MFSHAERTALFEEHQRLNGKLIDFGGWELPVQYTGLTDEHLACRSAAGMFDVSHMGEVTVNGSHAEAYLNYLVTNNVSKLAIGQAQYTVMCHDDGGIVDDLVIYRRSLDSFLVVVNASNTDKDFTHMKAVLSSFQSKHPTANVQIQNESHRYSQIALQGQKAAEILSKVSSSSLSDIKTYWFTEGFVCEQIPAILARTGYTGEDGFEIYVAWEKGPEVWRALLEVGTPLGLKPCGLGARDTLRMEMKFPLYGNELNDQTHPLETGLSWVTKLDKGDFVGREGLRQIKEKGIERQLAGIRMLDNRIPRHGYSLLDESGEQVIGEVTSGTQSPSLKQPIGMALVKTQFAKVGTKVTVDIRGTKVPAEIVPTPFYKRTY